jgi:hypothetical protein
MIKSGGEKVKKVCVDARVHAGINFLPLKSFINKHTLGLKWSACGCKLEKTGEKTNWLLMYKY